LTTIGVFLMARTKSSARQLPLSPVFLPLMISTSIIRSTGEKKWMPTKSFGRFDALASEVIGKSTCWSRRSRPSADRLGPADHVLLDGAVLEHRLDRQVDIGKHGEIGADRNAGQRGIGVVGLHAALATCFL
jgi:hypothetical protein